MVRIITSLVCLVVIGSSAYGISRRFTEPVPQSVLQFINSEARKNCPSLPKTTTVTYPTRHKISEGWIYSSDFVGGSKESYLIVVETNGALEVEDIHCPTSKNRFLAL